MFRSSQIVANSSVPIDDLRDSGSPCQGGKEHQMVLSWQLRPRSGLLHFVMLRPHAFCIHIIILYFV